MYPSSTSAKPPGESENTARSAGGVISYFVHHGTAANLLVVLLLTLGLAASLGIRTQFFPDVIVESITVTVNWSGAGPQEVDQAIVARMEPVLRGVEGVDELVAKAREGRASFTVSFEPGWDMASALDDVTAAVETVTDLPDGIDAPTIRRNRFYDRVTDILITGPVSLSLLDQYAEETKNALFRAGVRRTAIKGVSAPILRVDAEPDALERYGVTLRDLAAAIGAETGTQPVGEINNGAARVRTLAGRDDPEKISQIAVRSLADGTKLRVHDLAYVYEEGLDRGLAYYSNGEPAIAIQVDRDAAGDTVDLHNASARVVAAMANTLPEGVTIELVRTRAQAISDRLDILIRNGAQGLLIVLLLLFAFLSARTAFWVAAGIPVAMAGTVALMYATGMTINMVSLFGLIICLGIVVDDAIVVGEHADTLARRGFAPADAATRAALTMASPVFAASITTVIAFSGLIAIGGRFGDLIIALPLTVAAVITISLVESFIILPAHMHHALAHRQKSSWIDAPSRYVNLGFAWFKTNAYVPALRFLLRLRYPLLACGLFVLSSSLALFLEGDVTWRFFSAPERGTLSANIAMLPGASRLDTKAQLDDMERALGVVGQRFAERHQVAPVINAVATIGGTAGRGLANTNGVSADLLGGFRIELIDPDKRPYSAFEFINAWRAEIKHHPMLDRLVLRGEHSGPGGDAIHVRLSGQNAVDLKRAAQSIAEQLRQFPAVTGVEDDLPYDKPEFIVTLTAKGEALGFTTASVARALRDQLDGIEAVSLPRDGKDVEVQVRLSPDITHAGFLYTTLIPTNEGEFVPLADIAKISETQGFATITRQEGAQVVNVTGELSDDADAAQRVSEALIRDILPDIAGRFSVNATTAGLAEQEREFLSDALVGTLLCLIGIFITLTWILRSWSRPLLIILMIPFGVIGAIWGHWFHNLPLSMFSVVGLIGMAGIIINDSIVLMTTIHRRAATQDMRSAIIDGAADRLRAVLLTTLTTVGGLAPLLLEQSRQALFLKPTVVTLAYGLGFGVVIILFLTPAITAIYFDIVMSLRSARRFPRAWARRQRQLRPPTLLSR